MSTVLTSILTALLSISALSNVSGIIILLSAAASDSAGGRERVPRCSRLYHSIKAVFITRDRAHKTRSVSGGVCGRLLKESIAGPLRCALSIYCLLQILAAAAYVVCKSSLDHQGVCISQHLSNYYLCLVSVPPLQYTTAIGSTCGFYWLCLRLVRAYT